MRIVRYQKQNEAPKYGWLLDRQDRRDRRRPFRRVPKAGGQNASRGRETAGPSEPSKIVCVGRNYVEHAKELGNEVPKIPLLFLKPPSSIINPNETIILPPQSKQVEHEGELVVVIGKRARNVTAEDAKNYIYGYTIGNDVTARDSAKNGRSMDAR